MCQNSFQAIIKTKKEKKTKWHGPLSHKCREGKTLVVPPLKKTLFSCVSSHREGAKKNSTYKETCPPRELKVGGGGRFCIFLVSSI